MPPVRAFVIHPADNVATLIDDAASGAEVACLGVVAGGRPLVAREAIARGHKIAIAAVGANGAVTKYGVRIGHAMADILPGAWVHLHNLASDLDTRSSTLDRHSGVPTDTSSAYV